MNANDLNVFNPGAPAPVKLTLAFQHASDAAWVTRALVAAKRDGGLSRLMTAILRDSVAKVVHVPVVEVDGKKIDIDLQGFLSDNV